MTTTFGEVALRRARLDGCVRSHGELLTERSRLIERRERAQGDYDLGQINGSERDVRVAAITEQLAALDGRIAEARAGIEQAKAALASAVDAARPNASIEGDRLAGERRRTVERLAAIEADLAGLRAMFGESAVPAALPVVFVAEWERQLEQLKG